MKYIVYVTKSLDAKENGAEQMTFMNWIHNLVSNCKKCTIMWTSDDDESLQSMDGSNGDVGLILHVKVFNLCILRIMFGEISMVYTNDINKWSIINVSI